MLPWTLLFVGCTPPEAPADTATLSWPSTASRSVDAVRHAPDGQWVERWRLEPGDSVDFDAPPGTSVTAMVDGPFTIFGVEPGDVLQLTSKSLDNETWPYAQVHVSLEDIPDAVFSYAAAFCDDATIAATTLLSRDLEDTPLWVDPACAAVGTRVDVIAWADGVGQLIAYTGLEDGVVSAEPLQLPPWQEPVTDSVAVLTNVPPDETYVAANVWLGRFGLLTPGPYRSTVDPVVSGQLELPVAIAPPGILDQGGICVYVPKEGEDVQRHSCRQVEAPFPERLTFDDFGPDIDIQPNEEGVRIATTNDRGGTIQVLLEYAHASSGMYPHKWQFVAPAVGTLIPWPTFPEDMEPTRYGAPPRSYQAAYLRSNALPDYEAWRRAPLPLLNSAEFPLGRTTSDGAIFASWWR